MMGLPQGTAEWLASVSVGIHPALVCWPLFYGHRDGAPEKLCIHTYTSNTSALGMRWEGGGGHHNVTDTLLSNIQSPISLQKKQRDEILPESSESLDV